MMEKITKPGVDSQHPWRNEETLKELYSERKLTAEETATKLGCSASTIRNWLQKFGIPTREGGLKRSYAPTSISPKGYERWHNIETERGTRRDIFVHQLTVIADGANPRKVFNGGEYTVHHKNEVPWDNRPDNLVVLSASDHAALHHENGTYDYLKRYDDTPWRSEDVLSELYCEKALTQPEIAEQLGCSVPTIRKWMREYNIDSRSQLEAAANHYKHEESGTPWRNKETLKEAYQTATTHELAEQWGCCSRTILNWLHRFGIPRRNGGESPSGGDL